MIARGLRCLVAAAVLVGPSAVSAAEPRPQPGLPSEVRLVQLADSHWQLEVNGQPFFVRGAGAGGGSLATLAAAGGNAIRTWHGDRAAGRNGSQLDLALRSGLFVAYGLEVGRERHGFDYGNARAVARQLERLCDEVRRHRDHPALLLWVVGNELNLEMRDPRVWDAVNEIVTMIRREDPRHPILTPLAGINADVLRELRQRAPALELLGVQLYGDIEHVSELRASGWDGPYLITEWGPTGHWEVARTSWGAPIEEDSHQKAQNLLRRYRDSVLSNRGQGLGSFVFLWGQKQERTPTWYGMFLETGEATAAVDAMQQLWTGVLAEQPAPMVRHLRLDGRSAVDSVTLAPRQAVEAAVEIQSASGGKLEIAWQVREESRAVSIGGDPETLPRTVRRKFTQPTVGHVAFEAPRRPGEYRLFVIVRDAHGKAGHANFPFRVARD